MNPPSALNSAMSRERKPFTYTPGGLNLSEIKSERMAQRLMRNAMNQGIPEKPVQNINSPPIMAPNAVPNFNCLPVQVFPTFALPANPKSLLRTRSNPDTLKPIQTVVPKFGADSTPTVYSYKHLNKPSVLALNNNNDNNTQSIFNDCNTAQNNYSIGYQTNFESNDSKGALPQTKINSDLTLSNSMTIEPNAVKNKINEHMNSANNDEDPQVIKQSDILFENIKSNEMNSVVSYLPQLQDKKDDDDYEKKQVKIAKKETQSSNEVDQNGDTEAEIVVKLPSKKSAAKTETTVDVLKRTLPDGSVEEIKTTTTKTTVDGKTQITTKTEITTFPKEVNESDEIEEEYDDIIEKNGNEDEDNGGNEDEVQKTVDKSDDIQEVDNNETIEDSLEQSNEQNGHIIVEEEKSEKNTTKKVVISQTADQDSEEEVEEVEEEDDGETEDVSVEQVIVLKKSQVDNKRESLNQEEDNNEEIKEQKVEDEEEVIEDEEVVEDEYENEEEKNNTEKSDKVVEEQIEDKVTIIATKVDNQEIVENEQTQDNESIPDEDLKNIKEDEDEDEGVGEVKGDVEDEGEREGERKDEGVVEGEDEGEEEYVEAENIQEEIQPIQAKKEIEHLNIEQTKNEKISQEVQENNDITTQKSKIVEEKLPANNLSPEPMTDNKKHERKEEIIIKTTLQYEPKVGYLREPSVPLEKVEDVEIKPIGPAQEIFKKSHTEFITTTTDKPVGALSTQTEFNRVENIVTVNRTSKILDHAYEQIAPSAVPNLNTFFTQNNSRILSSPQPMSRPYQSAYQPEPQTERRHSLLLERLSVERQIPTDVYQNNYHPAQNQEQHQWLQEPQSEVLTVSNVKPSEITKNQQWYQQTRKEESIYNTITPTPTPNSNAQWNKPQVQQNYQPQPQVHVQPQLQPQYQPCPQPQYAPKPEFKSYTENISQNKFNNYQQNTYPTYVPKPTWVSSTFDPKPTVPQPDQFSIDKKESTESYQTSTQQLSSSYVPPPWEQDTSYVSNTTNYYQLPPPTTSVTPKPLWKPQPTSKFSKPAPMSYVPPAPNQSFVKPVTDNDQPRLPGRKTYYSEYERRYISVPEATYVPVESKLQAQPDPSPQYYYNNNEPTETIEPQWRRELREFTEKTQTTQTETTSVRPPWEEDSKYTAPSEHNAPPPTSWTQTLRPRSWRETSYEPEYASSKEWPRTNTLGRGRPQSSYVKSNVDTLPQRPRGVSVDRYNPNSYLPPTLEHPPVQSQTMNPNIQHKTYHNPTVPGYHARVSAETREQPAVYIQPRSYVDSRTPPVQSRSFKYLQWITGTED